MKKNKLLAGLIAFLVLPAFCRAEQQEGMVIYLTDGTKQEMAFSGIRKLTFADNQFGVVGTSEGATDANFAYSSVRKIVFDLKSAGVGKVEASAQWVVSPNPVVSQLSVVGYDAAEAASVAIYSMDGQLRRSIANWDGTPINVESLPSGIYLLTLNDQTFKFVKR